MSTGRTIILAFVVCSVMASIAGFYLAAEVQVGSPIIGNQALESIAAAVLGGASLAGGRGSFFGTLLAAFFLTEINNVLPFFQQPTEYAEMAIGVLILLALAALPVTGADRALPALATPIDAAEAPATT